MRAASRSGFMAVMAGIGLFVSACGGTTTLTDGAASKESPSTLGPPAPTSVVPPSSSLPSAAADASSPDPVVAFRGLDAARRALYAHPDPARVESIWAPGSAAYELASFEIDWFAAQNLAVDERGFELASVTLIEANAQVAQLRTVLGPGDGSVPGIDRTWNATSPVTFDVTLVTSADGRWRIANDVEIGAIE